MNNFNNQQNENWRPLKQQALRKTNHKTIEEWTLHHQILQISHTMWGRISGFNCEILADKKVLVEIWVSPFQKILLGTMPQKGSDKSYNTKNFKLLKIYSSPRRASNTLHNTGKMLKYAKWGVLHTRLQNINKLTLWLLGNNKLSSLDPLGVPLKHLSQHQ